MCARARLGCSAAAGRERQCPAAPSRRLSRRPCGRAGSRAGGRAGGRACGAAARLGLATGQHGRGWEREGVVGAEQRGGP
eukprot:scaffold94230_cov59-Phaeocystis_antarctica.AAC.2